MLNIYLKNYIFWKVAKSLLKLHDQVFDGQFNKHNNITYLITRYISLFEIKNRFRQKHVLNFQWLLVNMKRIASNHK